MNMKKFHRGIKMFKNKMNSLKAKCARKSIKKSKMIILLKLVLHKRYIANQENNLKE